MSSVILYNVLFFERLVYFQKLTDAQFGASRNFRIL
jgi:hypothetical protein